VFVSSCDLPFPNRAIMRHLCAQRNGFDAVVPVTAAGYEPLFAVYAKNCLGPMRGLLEGGNYCVYDFYPRVAVRYVQHGELTPLDPEGTAFLNVNTPEQFEQVQERLISLRGTGAVAQSMREESGNE
jgi:molybdopterin-guanine dinucleotide biosynthesis protein A